MTYEQAACDDLKAFERRLTEAIASVKPITNRWRTVLALSTLSTSIGAYYWLSDPQTAKVSFIQSLYNHLLFTISSIVLMVLLLTGIHKKVIGTSIITSRVRIVLADFNMSCDDSGKLILRPRPQQNTS
ncbi:Nuclear envelope phosphatase-regulatory subunit 1 [Cinara cedri]|uniref:Transmembrane protein 188 n=1 Tax=Cinara cedri TaxID=506608 RepID=A0A5E4M3B5_9HEMI|nr:Nuclear envelope phosphatase-regulatory subunit 1 [Cinara cedri]